MKKTSSDQNISLTPQIIRSKMKEAEFYVDQGLFEEAKGIYLSLLKQAKSQIDQQVSIDDSDHARTQAMVRFFQGKMEEIEDKNITFYVQREGSDATVKQKAESDGEAFFNRAIAFKGIGLFDEAIEEFRRAAKLGYKARRCDREIAGALVLEGYFRQAIEIYYALLNEKGIDNSERVNILRSLARAYEAIGDDQEAKELHGELTLQEIEKRGHEPAVEKELGQGRPQRRFRWNISAVTEHPRISFAVTLLIALFFMTFVPFAKTVNNVDYLTLENDADVQFYEDFKEVFGNDEFFIIAFEKEDIFTEKNLTLIRKITEHLEELSDVREVKSLANVDDILGGEDYFEVRKFLEEIPSDEGGLHSLKRQATDNPLYVPGLISENARTAAIVVKVHEKPEDPDYRKRLLKEVTAVLEPYRGDVGAFHLAGWTTTNFNLSQYMKKDVATFIPLTYLFITLSIWVIFRNVRLVLLAVVNISLCVGSTMGLFGLTGITINNVTTIIPPLVTALALCDTVHIFSNMGKQVLNDFPDKQKALAHVLDKVFLPSFLTTLTTAIGFLSLAVSHIPPIREFAWIASLGMVFQFIYSFFLLPPLILLFDADKIYQDYEAKRGMHSFLRKTSDLVLARPGLLLFASALIVAGASWYAMKIRVETNIIECFKKDTQMRISLDYVERRLGGVSTLDISLRAQEENSFTEPENLRVIEEIQNYLKSLSEVDSAISLVDFLKDMNESFHSEDHTYYTIPETKAMVSQYLLLYDSDEIEDFVNSAYDHARIAVRISEHGSGQQKKLLNDITAFISRMNIPNIKVVVTGRTVNEVNIIEELVSGQITSLALSASVIIVLIILSLRSLTIGALSIVPNLFPIVLNFGIMGALSIPLDTGTALIAAVALGIAVDDTIHFLSNYRALKLQGIAVRDSIRMTILSKGRAIVSSSLILSIGFGVVIFSHFVPTAYFGLLSAVIMITALIGDLIILPSFICFLNRYRNEGRGHFDARE